MRDVPEIAPEVRGLMEEIVADPRSRLRLAPRRALSTWFDTGETARASDITRTKAERHLVEVHREELAALLCEASWISYWKAPVLANRPVGADGNLYSPTECEPDWRERASREIRTYADRSGAVELLRQCLAGIRPGQGMALGEASLALAPRDLTRFHITLSIPWDRPRVATTLLRRLGRSARPLSTRRSALLSLAARNCSLGLLEEARDIYRQAATLESPCGAICAFNLSCFVGDERRALVEAQELGQVASLEDPRVTEVQTTLGTWIADRSREELGVARDTARKLLGRVPEVAASLCRRYES